MRALLALLVLLPLAAAHADEASTAQSSTVVKEEPEDAPARGPRYAPVTVEFFCSYLLDNCRTVDDLLHRMVARHPRRLRVVYRQATVPYKDSQPFAEAAVEAWRQGRFFELHDLLYAQRGRLTRADIEGFARRAGLDLDALRRALAAGQNAAVVERDGLRRDQLGLVRLPALVWNGKPQETAAELEFYEKTYDRAYAEARKLLDDGVPLRSLYAELVREAAQEPPSGLSAGRRSRRIGGVTVFDPAAPRASVRSEGAPTRGAAGADVTIAVFSDFECPYCARLQSVLRSAEQLYPGRIRFVFKHFPLSFHRDARLAAEVGACAQAQGRFWEFHDAVFSRNGGLKRDDLLRYAGAAGIDVERLIADLDAGRCAPRVDGDVLEGKLLGVDATPTLFVNGITLVGLANLNDLRRVIDDEVRPGWLESLTSAP